MASITEKAMFSAIRTALERLEQVTPQIIIGKQVIKTIIRKHHLTRLPGNARSYMELGRNSILEPLLLLIRGGTDLTGKKLFIDNDESGNIDLKVCA